MNARYYDPSVQRFTQEDTYQGDNLQYNLYGYCSANPVMYVDPSGYDAIWINDSEAVMGYGHSSLILQYYYNNKLRWYYTYFGSDNGKDTVICKEIPDTYMKSLAKLNSYLHTGYDISIYIQGDFNESYKYFWNNYYSYRYNKGKSQYNLFTNNCTTASWNALFKGYIKDGTSASSFINTFHWYDVNYAHISYSECWVPNDNYTTIWHYFRNTAFTKEDSINQIKAYINYSKSHSNDKSYYCYWTLINPGAYYRGMVKILPKLI